MAGEIPLLEREEPMLRLEAALDEARRGRGQLVSLEGEAGIGKTSLVLQFAAGHRRDARVYVGGCEHLATPEPLGPFRDVARASAGRFEFSPSSPLATFESLLRLLATGQTAALLVIEDLHWADDATLDLIRYLGRRIRDTAVLVVTTLRTDEPESQSSLAALWSDLPRDTRQRIELRPLTADAVSVLATRAGRDPAEVYETTGGNPFRVTEYLAVPEGRLPPTVRDATLARAAALDPAGRRVLDVAAIFPRHVEQATLRDLADDATHSGVEQCLHSGMLIETGRALAFRHELARRAVYGAISPLRRRELHRGALAWLVQHEGRAAEIAHHAERADAAEETRRYSMLAADQAMALGAHREAVAHLTRALVDGAPLAGVERAAMLEQLAVAGEQSGSQDVALRAIDEAVPLRRAAGDALGLGNALRIRARLLWNEGQAELAERCCVEAVSVLERRRDSWQYAMALASQSQLDMLACRFELAIRRGTEAMTCAERCGRSDIYLEALTNVASVRCMVDLDRGVAELLAGIEEARRRGHPEQIPRMYTNLTYNTAHERHYAGLFDNLQRGMEAAVARDAWPLEGYMRGVRATALLDLGRLHEAVEAAEYVTQGPYPRRIARFPAQLALSRGRVRLGIPEGGELEEARKLPMAGRDPIRRAPIAVADAEAAWLGLPRPKARANLRSTFEALNAEGVVWWPLAQVALWLAILDEAPRMPYATLSSLRPPYRLCLEGRWSEAAEAWRALGAPYEQAIALSRGPADAQREALAIFDRLGAVPAAANLRRTMRARGVGSVPRGPNAPTRSHPAGLTRRQAEVLALIARGLSNAEIARRLYITEKTAEHHVSAVLERLGVATRRAAVEAARTAGVLDDGER